MTLIIGSLSLCMINLASFFIFPSPLLLKTDAKYEGNQETEERRGGGKEVKRINMSRVHGPSSPDGYNHSVLKT